MPDARVVIIEDQTEMRFGLAALIDRSEGFTCSRSFASMERPYRRRGATILRM
jgi:hypothetical protein